MELLIKKLLDFIMILAGCLVAMLGGIDDLMKLLFVMMVIDVIAGVCIGVSKNKFSIRALFVGGLKKCLELGVIIIAFMADRAFGTEIWRMGAMVYYVGYEGISVTGNLGLLGVPLPKKLVKLFANMREDENKVKE